jgi:hypothetical protein
MTLDRPPLRYARASLSPKVVRARHLAAEIEQLLGGLTTDEIASGAYQVRLAQGLTRSLIDQLDELERDSPSSRNIPISEERGPGAYAVRSTPGR